MIDIYKVLKEKEGKASITDTVKEYDIAWETLRDRLYNSIGSREEYVKVC